MKLFTRIKMWTTEKLTLSMEPMASSKTNCSSKTDMSAKAKIQTKAKSEQKKAPPQKQQKQRQQRRKPKPRQIRGIRPQFSGVTNAIAKALALPGSCPNLRIKNTAGDAHPTAVVALHSAINYKQPVNAGTYASMPQGTCFTALFRDPFRSTIQFIANSATAPLTYTYTAYFRPPVSGGVIAYFTTAAAAEPGYTDDLEPLYWVGSGAFQPHGKYLYPGYADDRSAVWLDLGATITITQSTSDTAAKLIVSTYNGGFEEVITIPFVASTAVFTQLITTGSYIQLRYITATTTVLSNQLAIVLSGNGDVFAHLAVPNISNHLLQLTRCRVNAASALLSPAASVLNISGTIFGGDIEPNNMWTSYAVGGAIGLLPQGNYDDFKFAQGMYAFLKPGDINELAMKNSVATDGTFPTRCGFNLNDNSRYLVFYLTSDVTGTTAAGNEYLLTLNWDIEYQTSDQWFETHLASGMYRDTEMALEVLSRIPVFHENPLHFSDVLSAIKGGYNLMRRHAPNIAKTLSLFAPHLSTPANFIGNAVNSLPEW
jgi:hypothetical protein